MWTTTLRRHAHYTPASEPLRPLCARTQFRRPGECLTCDGVKRSNRHRRLEVVGASCNCAATAARASTGSTAKLPARRRGRRGRSSRVRGAPGQRSRAQRCDALLLSGVGSVLARCLFDRVDSIVSARLFREDLGGNDRAPRIVCSDVEGSAQIRDDHAVIVLRGEFGSGCDQQGDAVLHVGRYRHEPDAL